MTAQRFIEPLDILFLRDNHLFGAAGAASRALMPPWPSVFAGALRSRMLADAGARISDLKNGTLPTPLDTILGTPENPGHFTLGEITVARRSGNGTERFRPLPADIVATESDGPVQLNTLIPQALPKPLLTSADTTQLPVLRCNDQAKPTHRYWLNEAGWQAYLRGEPLNAEYLCATTDLWTVETRLGIALDADQRRAADGHLYTSDAIALKRDVGFLVAIHGADDAIPDSGLLRLGGDGRGARLHAAGAPSQTAPDWERIARTGRFRLILTSPGLFESDRRLPGMTDDGHWPIGNAMAQLDCRITPRHEVISGWDLNRGCPKAALRCVPAGAVYWFKDFDGDTAALRKLSETGLWNHNCDNHLATRRAEGFNRVTVANA